MDRIFVFFSPSYRFVIVEARQLRIRMNAECVGAALRREWIDHTKKHTKKSNKWKRKLAERKDVLEKDVANSDALAMKSIDWNKHVVQQCWYIFEYIYIYLYCCTGWLRSCASAATNTASRSISEKWLCNECSDSRWNKACAVSAAWMCEWKGSGRWAIWLNE